MNLHLVIIGFVALTNIKCHVTNRTKNLEVTTQFFVDNKQISNQYKEISENKYDATKPMKTEERSNYLEDVLLTLKNQNWTKEEKPCFDHIILMLHSLQNFTLWAVWDWDAQPSEPLGLLFGSQYQLGNFDQCLSAPWSDTHKELRTKYCLVEIVFERTGKGPVKTVKRQINEPLNPYQSALDFIEYHPPHTRPLNEITWGACVPESCHPRSVERLLDVMLARSHISAAGMRANISSTESCQTYDDHREFDGLFYAFMAMMGILTAISLICTYLNNRNKQSDPDNYKIDFIKAFCLKENAINLLKVKKEGIEIFYGIRFLTMCLIVLDHQIALHNSGPVSDGYIFDQEAYSPLALLILHDDIFVDSFFLLSGFFTATGIAKIKKLPNPLLIIFKRYIRLLIALAVVVFYISAVFPYTGAGPLWNRVVAQETEVCRKNWWLNLLMVSNYIDTQNFCLVVSWYIPCDFHFFVITVLIYWVYKHLPRLGLTCVGLVTVASIIVPGVINYVYQLPPVQLFTFDFLVDLRGNKEFHITYIKSHTRFAAYLVGFYSGFIFLHYSAKGNMNKISKKWSVLGVYSAVAFMLIVMAFGSTFLWFSYHPLLGAVYAALNRPAWACFLALFVLVCSFGRVPVVKSFLSWYPWVPLSRLSYGVYLSHFIIIARNVFTARNPRHNNYFEIINATVGVTFWACLASLLIWLLAEAPANKLLDLCLKSRFKKVVQNEEHNTNLSQTTSLNIISAGGSGHLRDNLPATVHLSSKI